MTDKNDVKKIIEESLKPVDPNQRLMENWVTACKLKLITDMIEVKITGTTTIS